MNLVIFQRQTRSAALHGRLLCAVVTTALALLLVAACGREDAAPSEQAAANQQAAAAPAQPDFSPAGLEAEEVQEFLGTLQQAVARDDREAVAALVSYPLTVRMRAGAVELATPQDFLTHYSDIMTEAVRRAIAESAEEELFANYQGVRLGSGELWFAGVYPAGSDRYEIRIVAVNPT